MLSSALLLSFAALCAAAPGAPASWTSSSWPSSAGPPDADLWASWPSWKPRPSPGSPVVALASGLVVGTTTAVALSPATGTAVVNKYLGIPFAMSPPERFSPPQDAARWYEPLDATQFRNSCIQQFNYPEAVREATIFFSQGTLVVPEDEDCLYLNVWTPATPSRDGQLRTVMLWIYGGTLETGFAGLPQYDGASFAANQDVVLVSINYRTNVFGFSNSPEIPFGQQNSGFLDQRKALEWVQQNIERLGGDPAKVTIFGESAGGYSVKQLLANPPSPLTFRAAILESEATTTAGGVASWNALVASCNCSTAASQITCVRAVPAETINSIIEHGAILFPPVADNITESANVAVQIKSKKWADVPILIGNNANEGRIFSLGQTNLTAYLQTLFPGQTALQAAIQAQYGLTSASTPTDNYYAIADVLTNIGFLCPVVAISTQAAAAGYDVWRFYFNASFPNTATVVSGAYHGSEITEVFGTYNRTGATTQQIALSAYMQTAWADFAKSPSNGPGWPKVGSAVATLGDLGGNGALGEYTIDPATVDGVCSVYAPILAVTGI